jgi:transcriptional regulator with PAS, ATPase and Fis domain
MTLQAKLLKFLDMKIVRRVGGTRDIVVDVRILAATNRDLSEEVRQGRFREDLFYRLNVVPIVVPPLRDRGSDITILAHSVCERVARKLGRTARISPAAERELMRYPWPGNVRELENCIERAVVLTRNSTLTVDDLPPQMREGAQDAPARESDEVVALKTWLEDPERRYIEHALRRMNGNRQETAKALDINRTTLFNKMRKYGLLEKY